MRETSVAALERQVRARIARLGDCGQFIIGSLVESKRRCGNKNCACANGGPPHSAWIITKNTGGKTRSVYVPVSMVPELRKWTAEYKKLKALIKEIDQLGERIIAVSKRRKKAQAAEPEAEA